jgi:hypothetical protein
LPLGQGYKWSAGGDLIRRGCAACKVQQCAAVLFDRGDGFCLAGRIVIGVEHRGAAPAKHIGPVEGVGIIVMHEYAERLGADFHLVLAACNHDVIVDLQIALAVVQVLTGGSAANEVPGHLDGRVRLERCLRGPLPGVADVGLVQCIRAQRLGVGQAQIILAHQARVSGLRKRKAADTLIAEVVDVR